ncbi:MAG TPA: hypothetical protein VGE39_25545 [Prosthecobacter sp.]
MLRLLLLFFLVVSVVYGLPALILWCAFDLSLLQIVVISGIIGTLLIVVLSALDAPAFLAPGGRKKARQRKD